MLVVKQGGKFKTNVCRKPLLQIMNLISNYLATNAKKILYVYYISLLCYIYKTLYSRAKKIYSPEFLQNELNNINTITKLKR